LAEGRGRLRDVRRAYAEIGVAGIPAMRLFIDPATARSRRASGHKRLYDEIMEFKL